MNLDFFAVKADQRAIFDFLFSSTDVRVFESYSEYGADLREFQSTDELAAAFPIGIDRYGNGNAVLLQLWSPSVMRRLTIRRVALDPRYCKGHTFRYCIEGGGLIQLYLGGVCKRERVVTMSHCGHWSEIGAQKWGKDRGVTWEALKTLSNRIRYHIRTRLAVAKVPGRPVLPQAYELAQLGFELKLAAQTPWAFQLQSPSDRRRKTNKPLRT
jgi:hypothetical protein